MYVITYYCRIVVNFFSDMWSVVQAVRMIKEIKDAFTRNLPNLSWMDKETRESARAKAKAVIDMIGFPEYILNKTALDERYEKVLTWLWIYHSPVIWFSEMFYITSFSIKALSAHSHWRKTNAIEKKIKEQVKEIKDKISNI